jgi:hypothetical protein
MVNLLMQGGNLGLSRSWTLGSLHTDANLEIYNYPSDFGTAYEKIREKI